MTPETGTIAEPNPWRLALAAIRETSGTLFAAMVGAGTASFGFGALARATDFSLLFTVMNTATIWALPAQVAFVDVYAKDGGATMIVLAVGLANFRFLPMSTSTAVMLGMNGRLRPWHLAYAFIMTMVAWAQMLVMQHKLPLAARAPYYLIFAGSLYIAAILATAAGHLAAGALPGPLATALFLSPVLFLLLVMSGARDRLGRLAYVAGAVAVPLCELAAPGWGLVVGGVLGGSLAFALDGALERRRAG